MLFPAPLLYRELTLPADVTEFVVTTSDGTVRVYAVPEGVKRLTLTVTPADGHWRRTQCGRGRCAHCDGAMSVPVPAPPCCPQCHRPMPADSFGHRLVGQVCHECGWVCPLEAARITADAGKVRLGGFAPVL